MAKQEPRIRILVGKITNPGTDSEVLRTAVVSINDMPKLEKDGWVFVIADPDDLDAYLTWLYQREIERL